MAKLEIRSGRRGRPLSIDPEKELHDLIFEYGKKAHARLRQLAKGSSGVRDVATFGSETEWSKAMESAKDVLVDLQEGQSINYETLKELKQNLRTARELASKQKRVYGRALEQQLTEEYFSQLDYFAKNESANVRASNERLKEGLRQLTPRERQSYFLSRRYQDPATMGGTYESVRAWASKENGKELTMSEAWAYIRESNLQSFDALIAKGKKNFMS